MPWLTNLYRWLRNTDRIEAAQRRERVVLRMVVEAQRRANATEAQLAACRAVLAVTMRQRDDYEKAVEVLAHKLADLKMKRKRERRHLRYWLTRTIRPHEERSWN